MALTIISNDLKVVNLLEAKVTRAAQYGVLLDMGAKAIAASDVKAIAGRLTLLRAWRQLTPRQACAQADISESRWSNWENARGRPDLEGAIVLTETFGVTLDWIYYGDTSGLATRVASELAATDPNTAPRGRTVA